MNEIIKQFQNIFLIDLNLKPSIVLKINDAIPNSEKNTVAYVIEHYSAIAKNLSSNGRQDLRKALKEVGVPDGLLPGKGRPKTEPSKKRDYWPHSITESEEEVKESLGITQEEPKESALKEPVEQLKESVKEFTDSVKDAIEESQNPATMLGVDVDGDKKLLTTKPIPDEDIKKALGMVSATISGNALVDGPMKMFEDVRQDSIIVITPFNAVRVVSGSMAYMAALNVFYGFEVVDKARRELEKAEEMLQQAREELALLMEDEDGNT